MQRKHVALAASAALIAAGAAMAVTMPSSAESIEPRILAAMERDLGLGPAEAHARNQRIRWASRVSSTLAAETGGDYAGSWLAQDGTTLKVAVTRRAAAERVAAAGAEPVLVTRSEQALDAAKQRLDDARAGAADLAGWYVDPASNRVVVQALPGRERAAWRFARQAGVDDDAVAVRSAPRATTFADVRGADGYLIGGRGRCSVGFAVRGGFATAGHCGGQGTTTSDLRGGTRGQVRLSVFPGTADMGFVAVENAAENRLLPVVNNFAGELLPVGGSTEAPVGAAVCRSGSTTGTRCGVIQAKNQTVVYPEGSVTGLTRTNVCAEGGDSGGPWLSGDQAQGMTSGGAGNCRTGGITFFQPVNELLAAANLTLLTTAGGQPAQEAATSCADLPIQLAGSISRQGGAQALPGGRAFRAAAGRQTACLDRAGFEVALQVLTRDGFRTVARSDDGRLSATVPAGTYRYLVVAASGSGSYRLGVAVP